MTNHSQFGAGCRLTPLKSTVLSCGLTAEPGQWILVSIEGTVAEPARWFSAVVTRYSSLNPIQPFGFAEDAVPRFSPISTGRGEKSGVAVRCVCVQVPRIAV